MELAGRYRQVHRTVSNSTEVCLLRETGFLAGGFLGTLGDELTFLLYFQANVKILQWVLLGASRCGWVRVHLEAGRGEQLLVPVGEFLLFRPAETHGPLFTNL